MEEEGAKVEAEVACGSARSRGSAAMSAGLLKRRRCLDTDGCSGMKGGREGTGGVVRVEKSVAEVLLVLEDVEGRFLGPSGVVVKEARRRDRDSPCSTWAEGFLDSSGLGSRMMGGFLFTAESVLRRGRVRWRMLSILLVMLRLAMVITDYGLYGDWAAKQGEKTKKARMIGPE